tara:strand:+ start:330 stop:896 length:567 start_codon:yes stop_codon:yes gene_type:complete
MKALELKFRLDDLLPEGRNFAGDLDEELVRGSVEGLVGTLGYAPVGPAHAKGKVYRTEGNQVVVSGECTLTVAFQCVRCLAALETCVSSRNDYVLVRRDATQVGQNGLTITDEDEGSDALTFEGDEINLEELFRQEIMLTLPMNPSCEQSDGAQCKGQATLGPLKAGDELDPRWAPLLELKKKMQSGQ